MPLDKNVKYDSAEYFEIKKKIKDLGRNTLIITELAQTKLSHRLIWELKEVVAELCIDSLDAKQPEEMVTKRNVKVWDFQANNAKMDSPSDLSGWYNSYNGDPFSEDEMKEYIDDTKQKLMPILSKQSRVLEVGVGGGQVALEMAQMVSLYDGCDISRVVLERLSYLIAHKNIKNIELFQCEAVEKNNRPLVVAMRLKVLGEVDKLKKLMSEQKLYSCKSDITFENELNFTWHGHSIKMIHTPGHSKGSCCIEIDDKYVFTGDSMIPNEKVLTRFPGGDENVFEQITLPYLMSISNDKWVMPGHGEPVQRFKLKYRDGKFITLEK